MPSTNQASPSPEVTVVGSIHQDLIIHVPTLPRPGETVLGSRHVRSPGGKGANQAVAASRMGAQVAMVGQVGDDPDGAALRSGLDREGIDVSAVVIHERLATGLAVVTVDEYGENAIVVSPGASGALGRTTVDTHERLVRGAEVVLVQLEVDLDTVVAATEWATGIVVLNPAPARALPPTLLDHVDVLVPNAVELARLVGAEAVPATIDEVEALVRPLAERCSVIVTLGEQGVLAMHRGDARHVPAPRVDVIDTTGAGDAFCGALCARLAEGDDLLAAVPLAVRAAAQSTTRTGAQPSLPTRDELEAMDGPGRRHR